MTARDLLALIALRDAQENLTRAIGWTVAVHHVDFPELEPILYGNFSDAAPALCWAHKTEGEMRVDDDGFRCRVLPLLPALEHEA
jgi:hypothetical protein